MNKDVIISWSGGKDRALALYEIQKSGEYGVRALITTVTADYDRVSMHGLRAGLIDSQSDSLGIPVEKIFITKDATNEEYETKLEEALLRYKDTGITKVVFGDLFLEDIKEYRETHMSKIGMECMFPLWKRDTKEIAKSFIQSGFRAVTVCVDTEHLDGKFVGREFDQRFLAELPEGIDPCGENGEFHTFVYDGPNFNSRIDHNLGERVIREGRFYYCDILPT
jgi:uncharacterized protein (TIGR00290 family)